jgi:hypothetical protein
MGCAARRATATSTSRELRSGAPCRPTDRSLASHRRRARAGTSLVLPSEAPCFTGNIATDEPLEPRGRRRCAEAGGCSREAPVPPTDDVRVGRRQGVAGLSGWKRAQSPLLTRCGLLLASRGRQLDETRVRRIATVALDLMPAECRGWLPGAPSGDVSVRGQPSPGSAPTGPIGRLTPRPLIHVELIPASPTATPMQRIPTSEFRLVEPRSYVPIDERRRPPLRLLGASLDYWPRATPRRPTSMPCVRGDADGVPAPQSDLLGAPPRPGIQTLESHCRRPPVAGTSETTPTGTRAAAATSAWLACRWTERRLNSCAVPATVGRCWITTKLSMAPSDYLHTKRRASPAAEIDRRRAAAQQAHRVEPSADCPGISPAEACGCLVQSAHLDLTAGR